MLFGQKINYFFAVILGLPFSLPFSFGFWGAIYFTNRYIKITLSILIPVLFSSFILGLFGFIHRVTLGFALLYLLAGVVGAGIAFLAKFLYKKYRA